MPIIKTHALQNGAVANFHILKSADIGQRDDHMRLSVHSFTSEKKFLEGAPPTWNTLVSMPVELVTAPLYQSIDLWLTTSPDSPFNGGSAIALDNPDLASARARLWAAIKAQRDTRKISGVKVGTHWFHSDPDSRTQQLALVIFGANLPVGISWKAMGGEFVTMTPALAQQILSATAISDQTIFARAEQHKALMEASSDPANYDYTTGWPPVYGGT